MSAKTLIITSITVLLAGAVTVAACCGYIIPPLYSAPHDKTVSEDGVVITEKGRSITVTSGGEEIWSLPGEVLAQDFLFDDIDRDGSRDLLVLCWKRGRYGSHRPTWVKRDEIKWSQHIYIYEVREQRVKPKWMASDIGIRAASWDIKNGILSITDTSGDVSKWGWIHWGLEKM
ncbi:MAG: hypothetical protein J5574_01050 [Lachnospiraceae bacterium]|nr:hypothetical protein [Lachnospiraceae bacterium]